MAFEEEELRTGVLVIFVEAQHKGARTKLRLVDPGQCHTIERPGRKVGMTNAEKLRRWRAAHPEAYAVHQHRHNVQRKAQRRKKRIDHADTAQRVEDGALASMQKAV